MSRNRNLMELAAAVVVAARRAHGDTIEALVVVARIFAGAITHIDRRKPRGGARKRKVERKHRRRAAVKNAKPPIAAVPEKEVSRVSLSVLPPVTALPPVTGIKVTLAADAESIEFRGRETKVTAKQAQLLALLAAASPNPVARQFIADKLWLGARPTVQDIYLSDLVTRTRNTVASVGLMLKTVRGVGIALQPAGA